MVEEKELLGLSLISKKERELPVKVLQFGTGVLLRGLPDLIVHEANEKGLFNGRIAMVKSTNSGSIDNFLDQDCLYTVGVRGISKRELVDNKVLCSSVSDLYVAASQWEEILELACQPELGYVFSNTTELGLTYKEEIIQEGKCPESFPGKLLACLKARFEQYEGDKDRGLVILPTELVSDNGTKLKGIVEKLAEYNHFHPQFMTWLGESNHFCNTLVDRIVPGSVPESDLESFNAELNYFDKNPIIAEPYALWAIEGSEEVKAKLDFCFAGSGAFVVSDISSYKEIKLRILNATHTFISGHAFLSGFELVKVAMADSKFRSEVEQLLFDEIIPAMGDSISLNEKEDFARSVLDRFSNPFLEHQWHSICFNYTMKMVQRCFPLVKASIDLSGGIPERMAAGLAAMIRFSLPVRKEGKVYYGEFKNQEYQLNDPASGIYSEIIAKGKSDKDTFLEILSDTRLWKTDLTQWSQLPEAVWKVYSTFK
ncbi:tagaturonate reductase [Jiulongibacter sp. NS-SX5]|uniref:tagaturonate reductase n=1 Tax=Jiulongibacter sp. NS-SX5 TaxID=3463854 RepID=UPI004058E9AE